MKKNRIIIGYLLLAFSIAYIALDGLYFIKYKDASLVGLSYPYLPIGLRIIKWFYCVVLSIGGLMLLKNVKAAWHFIIFASVGILLNYIINGPNFNRMYQTSLIDSVRFLEVISLILVIILNLKRNITELKLKNRERIIGIGIVISVNAIGLLLL